jgi:hypothetical protein
MEPDWEQTGIRTIIFFGGGKKQTQKQEMKL